MQVSAKDHQYCIQINGNPERFSSAAPRQYSYSNYKNIEIQVCKGYGQVRFRTGTNAPLQSYLPGTDQSVKARVDFMLDALRKMLLLHVLMYGSTLEIRSIRLYAKHPGKQIKTLIETSANPLFPFLHTPLHAQSLPFENKWNTEAIIEPILQKPRSLAATDLRISAVYAYLSGAARTHEMDKFLYLWTSMNACYSLAAMLYDLYLQLEMEIFMENHTHWNLGSKCRPVPENWQKHPERSAAELMRDFPQETFIKTADARCIALLLKMEGAGFEKPSTRSWVKNGIRFRDEHYGPSDRKPNNDNPYLYFMDRIFSAMTEEDLDRLYILLSEHRTDKVHASFLEGIISKEDVKWVEGIMKDFHISAFGLFLLVYPYLRRCVYIHGSISTLLFTFDVCKDERILHSINRLLENYLADLIPQIFEDDWLDRTVFYGLLSGRLKNVLNDPSSKPAD